MRIFLAALAALLLGAGAAQAQPRVFSQAELDTLLAPVALHPDGVLSQVLIAATYPDEVAAAAAWSRANAHLRGDEAVRAVQHEPWDPAVKALVAFPDLLARMDESPQWLADLGQAFLAQEAQVMDTVQGLRRRAQAAGHLSTTDHVAVYHQGEAIVVQPRTQVVYVHYYDPYVVYGPWWWPHYRPVFWRPWVVHPVVLVPGFFYTAPDWHRHHVRVIHRPVHVHVQHRHVEPGRWHHRRNIVTTTSPVRRVAPAPVVRPHVRVPESQRRPIVQSATPSQRQPMPAANGFSNREPNRLEPRRVPRAEPRREQRAEPRREQRDHRLDSASRGGGLSHDHSQRGGRHPGGARGNAPQSRRAH
jgi:hypothetical protein